MKCHRCSTELDSSARFCKNCGAATGANSSEEEKAAKVRPENFKGGQYRSYVIHRDKIEGLLDQVQSWLESQDFELERVKLDDDSNFMQIRSKGGWRRFVGMSTALSIHFEYANESLQVHIGEGKWMGKITTGAISWFVLWPLAVTTAVGAYTQMKYPEKVFDFIEAIV